MLTRYSASLRLPTLGYNVGLDMRYRAGVLRKMGRLHPALLKNRMGDS